MSESVKETGSLQTRRKFLRLLGTASAAGTLGMVTLNWGHETYNQFSRVYEIRSKPKTRTYSIETRYGKVDITEIEVTHTIDTLAENLEYFETQILNSDLIVSEYNEAYYSKNPLIGSFDVNEYLTKPKHYHETEFPSFKSPISKGLSGSFFFKVIETLAQNAGKSLVCFNPQNYYQGFSDDVKRFSRISLSVGALTLFAGIYTRRYFIQSLGLLTITETNSLGGSLGQITPATPSILGALRSKIQNLFNSTDKDHSGDTGFSIGVDYRDVKTAAKLLRYLENNEGINKVLTIHGSIHTLEEYLKNPGWTFQKEEAYEKAFELMGVEIAKNLNEQEA